MAAPIDRNVRAKKIARTAAPWGVTAIAIGAILSRFSIHEIVERVRQGNAFAMIPVAVVFTILHLLSAATWDWFVFRTIIPGLRWSSLARIKAGVTTLQSVSFVANQTAYGAWLARGADIGVRNAVGLIGVVGLCDISAGSIVITSAIYAGRADVLLLFKIVAPIVAVGLPCVLLVPRRRPLEPDRPSVFAAAVAVPRGAIVASIAGRMTTATMMATTTWAAARSFGMHVPYPVMLTYVPILVAVGSAPVNVMGFGVVQTAWFVFLPWAPGPQILAFQFLWNMMTMAGQVIRGAPFVRRVVGDLTRRNGDATVAKAPVDRQNETTDEAATPEA